MLYCKKYPRLVEWGEGRFWLPPAYCGLRRGFLAPRGPALAQNLSEGLTSYMLDAHHRQIATTGSMNRKANMAKVKALLDPEEPGLIPNAQKAHQRSELELKPPVVQPSPGVVGAPPLLVEDLQGEMSQNQYTENPSHISGSYLDGSKGRAFASSTAYNTPEQYERTLEHLKEVLINATPNGYPYWGNKGICVTEWTYKGKNVKTLCPDEPKPDGRVAERDGSTTRTFYSDGRVIERPFAIAFHTIESFEQKLAELEARFG
jgi:hypothetical protein